ncbi:GIN domain-containing protein [Larkinella soli]|uniref:GIN domain-containing protein n=1 Tax=Larkinella soli TaxID=1770527 RepID=UPI000FFB530B|nr:DUF2807 domain-containing protein [Larkinella soli]
MKHLTLFLFALVTSVAAAQNAPRPLTSFDKVIVSPLVSLVLTAGDQETVRFEYENVGPEKVNCYVDNRTLRIYLDGAEIAVKTRKYREGGNDYRKPVYENVRVTAYVTYKSLKTLEVRGEERVVCESPLSAEEFRLRVYGQADVRLAELRTRSLKAAFYGENKVTIASGKAERQLFRVFGENQVETEALTGRDVVTRAYGDNHLNLHASDRIHVMALGESEIRYAGEADLHRGLVIGDVTIRKTR